MTVSYAYSLIFACLDLRNTCPYNFLFSISSFLSALFCLLFFLRQIIDTLLVFETYSVALAPLTGWLQRTLFQQKKRLWKIRDSIRPSSCNSYGAVHRYCANQWLLGQSFGRSYEQPPLAGKARSPSQNVTLRSGFLTAASCGKLRYGHKNEPLIN